MRGRGTYGNSSTSVFNMSGSPFESALAIEPTFAFNFSISLLQYHPVPTCICHGVGSASSAKSQRNFMCRVRVQAKMLV